MTDVFLVIGALAVVGVVGVGAFRLDRRTSNQASFRKTSAGGLFGLFLVFLVDPFHSQACGAMMYGEAARVFDQVALLGWVGVLCVLGGAGSAIVSIRIAEEPTSRRAFSLGCALLAAAVGITAALSFGNHAC